MRTPPPRVVVTRGREKATDLVSRLRAGGLDVEWVPLIETQALVGPEDLAAAVEEVDDGWVAVTSAAAAGLVASCLAGPMRARVAALGPASAAPLGGLGAEGSLIADTDGGLTDADSLSRALLPRVNGARVLVVAAEGGRGVLAPMLREAGAEVTELVAYRTVLPREAGDQLRAALDPLPAAIVFASGSSARHAASIVAPALTPISLVLCIGPHTAAVAREHGWANVELAAEQSDAGLVHALVSRLTRGEQLW